MIGEPMGATNEGEWMAQWVWPAETIGPDNSYTYFRIEFDTDHPNGYLLHISADTHYRLWINGTLLGDGPPQSIPNYVYFDTHEISSYLQSGKNCIAVVVRYTGIESGRRPGFLAECETPHGTILATGSAEWLCQPAIAWVPFTFKCDLNKYDPHQEGFIAAREPEGWKLADFNVDGQFPMTCATNLLKLPLEASGELIWKAWKDPNIFDDDHCAGWEPPKIVRDAAHKSDDHMLWGRLTRTPIPPMYEQPIRPRSVTAVDECLSLANRMRPDLTILLSQAGRKLQSAKVLNDEHFVTGEGTVVMAQSDDHLRDRTVDGIYDPCVLLDMGQVQTAYVEFDIEGPAGATLDIGFAERLIDRHFNNAIDGQFALRYVLKEGRQRWRSFSWRGFRYMRLRLTDASRPIVIHDLQAIVTRYPFEQRGAFISSDNRLNGIFDMCRNTIQLCCHTGISDTPWREQCQNLGDVAAVTVGGIYACFGDVALPEKFYRQAAATQSELGGVAAVTNAAFTQEGPSDYNLWWIIGLLQHYRYSGNEELVWELFNVVRGVVNRALEGQGNNGLVRPIKPAVIDWANVEKSGECAVYNAIAYGALHAGIELANVVHSSSDATCWSTAANALGATFISHFWDDTRKVIADSVNDTQEKTGKVSEHANFAAIRFSLVSPDVANDLTNRLLVKQEIEATEAQPFFTSVILDALHSLGRDDLALNIIRDRWGKRMLDRGSTSCHEEWGISGTWRSGTYVGRMRSLSHAWSAHPATFLVRHLAGIEIIEPGCRVLRVSPTVIDLDFQSVFPTPLGPVRVSVQDGVTSVDSPENVSIIKY